jgi:carboxylesterase
MVNPAHLALPLGFAEAAKPVSVRTSSDVGILIVHGITSTPGSMAYPIQRFVEAGFNVEAPLLPGHGTQWTNMRGITWQEWLGALREPLRSLQSRCKRVFVCGLSLGGGLALLLANEEPWLSGIILINHLATVKVTPLVLAAPVAKYFLRSIPNIAGDIKEPGHTEPAYTRLCTFAGHQAILVAKEIQKKLPQITVPTLILKSGDDHVVPRESAEVTLQKLGSAQKEIVWLNNSYHVATMDYDKEIIMQKSLEFVAKH